MNTIDLIDLENIGTKPLCQYIKEHQEEEYFIFYSEHTHTPGHVLEVIPETVNVTFVNCKTGGKNAMDFCICTTAGKLSSIKTRKLKILSNDKGYDAMIEMLQEQGIRITREMITYQAEPDMTTISVLQENSKQALINVIQKQVPKKYQQTMLNLLPTAISRKEAYEMCQASLPSKMATETYRKLRKYIPKEVV